MIDGRVYEPGIDRPPFVEGLQEFSRASRLIDPRFLVVQSLCRVVDLSQQAVERLGNSYRGFKVGAAVLALDDTSGRMGIVFGGNYTPYKGADWNCAEKGAFERARQRGFNRVLAVGVTGPLQPDSESGIESPTLHPCYRCRAMMDESDMTAPDTLIATSNLQETAYELFDLEGLLALHRQKITPQFPDYHPQLPMYWNQITSYDREAEMREYEILRRMATQLR